MDDVGVAGGFDEILAQVGDVACCPAPPRRVGLFTQHFANRPMSRHGIGTRRRVNTEIDGPNEQA